MVVLWRTEGVEGGRKAAASNTMYIVLDLTVVSWGKGGMFEDFEEMRQWEFFRPALLGHHSEELEICWVALEE